MLMAPCQPAQVRNYYNSLCIFINVTTFLRTILTFMPFQEPVLMAATLSSPPRGLHVLMEAGRTRVSACVQMEPHSLPRGEEEEDVEEEEEDAEEGTTRREL